MTEILAVKNLAKAYGKLQAVKAISFAVNQGECFGLLGPNGAGKTTTVEMMEGIIKPDSGDILFHGNKLDRRFFENIGIQFQHTALMDYLKVGETVELYASFYKQTMDIGELKNLCALDEIWSQDARKLSGGQKQRLLLALALVNDPQIIFLDEPTTGLDPQARRSFWQLIENIKKAGKTILLTTHYMDEAQRLCDRIAIMDQGEIVVCDEPQHLLAENFSGQWLWLPDNGLHTMPEGFECFHGGWRKLCHAIEQDIALLQQQNISLDGLSIQSPNLEDLFIKLTGHELRS